MVQELEMTRQDYWVRGVLYLDVVGVAMDTASDTGSYQVPYVGGCGHKLPWGACRAEGSCQVG